jgi:hypothetical protein
MGFNCLVLASRNHFCCRLQGELQTVVKRLEALDRSAAASRQSPPATRHSSPGPGVQGAGTGSAEMGSGRRRFYRRLKRGKGLLPSNKAQKSLHGLRD